MYSVRLFNKIKQKKKEYLQKYQLICVNKQELSIMESLSDTKHTIVCRNLQDIIKESLFSTKRNTIEDINKKQSHKQLLKSQPKLKKYIDQIYNMNATINTSISNNNNNSIINSGIKHNNSINNHIKNNQSLNNSAQKLNSSHSKHSLESKDKINFSNASSNAQLLLTSNNQKHNSSINNSKASKHPIPASSAVEFYPSANKNIKSKPFHNSIPTNHTQSLYFNQVDAIFTELQDFLRQTRQKICLQIGYLNEQNSANLLTNQLTQLSNLFRHQIQKLFVNQLDVFQNDPQVLKPKNNNLPVSQNKPKYISQPTSASKSSKQPVFSRQQLIKIQKFMQKQNTINSTINSQPHEDQYLPTQTDAQLLSMLVYKNKVNNTKRKIQNTYGHGQDMLVPWPKSGRGNKDIQGEYSFRKGNPKQKDIGIFNVETSSGKKKKNQHFATQKSCNKQNRQKSIYQIVLQQNRKSKGNWIK